MKTQITTIVTILLLTSCMGSVNTFQRSQQTRCKDILIKQFESEYSSILSIDTLVNQGESYVLSLEVKSVGKRGIYLLHIDENTDSCICQSYYIDTFWQSSDEGELSKYKLLEEEELLGYEDVNGDGVLDFFILRKAHNGTLYNGVVKCYFSFLNNDLIHLFNLETKTVSPLEDNILLIRELRLGQISVFARNLQSNTDVLIGAFAMRWENGKAKIVDPKVFVETYRVLLITGSGEQLDYFLNPYDNSTTRK